MSKRAKTAAAPPEAPITRTTMVDSAVLQFRLNYVQSKELAVGVAVHSDVVSVGGHQWRIDCYPRGSDVDDKGECLSIFLKHMSKTRSIKAIFEVFLMDRDGVPCTTYTKRSPVHEFPTERHAGDWGWEHFIRGTTAGYYVKDGHITFMCAIMVMMHGDSDIPAVPPSNIATDFGRLLEDHTDGTATTADVSFVVGGETFRAHRAVLAARSPVFRAELFGSMAEATMPSITLKEIKPATFRAMLRFMYTDELPGEDELQVDDSAPAAVEMFRDLLAAADRYALDRMKLLCAEKLWDKVSAHTVAATLACAETYNCPELTNRCVDFLAVEEHFKEAAFTHGYASLVMKFPSIIAELKKRFRPA